MAKPRSGAKKPSPAAKKAKPTKQGGLKSTTKRVAKAAAKLVKKSAGSAPAKQSAPKKTTAKAAVKKVAKVATKAAGKAVAQVKVAAEEVAKVATKAAAKVKEVTQARGGSARKRDASARPEAPPPPAVEKPKPRATKLPAPGEPLNKRDMEQLLTAGQGRGVVGEGSLKGRLSLVDGLPALMVVGRDKRELTFVLQGPDQEVLPAYVDHKVSVSGLIKKTTNYGGTVDVRKFSAKKPEAEEPVVPEPVEVENRLRYLSPGEVSQVVSAGMGAGMKGFAALRGNLEMTGEDFVLVVSNGGTRQQVSFILEGKGAKGLRKFLGHTLSVTGVADKSSGWGGRIDVENVEPRPSETRPISRDGLELVQVDGEQSTSIDVRLNHAFTVRLQEQPGFTWAIEPTAAKRLGLREANFEPGSEGLASREFFFTPRNPGASDLEFFLAKAFNPGQVERSFKLNVTVKP